ncbi:hypothetical protein AB1Y20_007239 [Prymnesium parvum]|uniref:nitrile hydratase n=1 Tax=Prymnesium parvum TaxID=97485 RepID=A0AB34IY17_PRYPA
MMMAAIRCGEIARRGATRSALCWAARSLPARLGSTAGARPLPVDDGAGQWRLQGPHDVGGAAALLDGRIDTSPGAPPAFWERRAHALLVHLVGSGRLKVDELRRGIEQLDEKRYASWGYYDKWAASMATVMLERGLLTEDELDDALGRSKPAATAEFSAGDAVRVLPDAPGVSQWRRPHLRVPGYLFGAVGVVERFVGVFDDPEFLAFRGSGVPQPLYRVRFSQAALGWRDEGAAKPSAVEAEVYASWLEPASHAQLAAANAGEEAARPVRAGAAACAHGHGGHDHGSRYEVEARDVAAASPEAPGERLTEALVAALSKNGTIDLEALRTAVCKVDELAAPDYASGPAALGPRLVAKAWVDPSFRDALLRDAQQALAAHLHVDATNATAPTKLIVVPNTAETHNLVVCTLCSCYPLSILGLSPAWYKDIRYRARAVRTPRSLLAEFGTVIPEETTICVHDSTADCRYIVLPQRPYGTEGWSEKDLAELVTRDSMIGVHVPSITPQ